MCQSNDPSLQKCFQSSTEGAVSCNCNTDIVTARLSSYSNHIQNCKISCSILIWNKLFKLKIAVKDQRYLSLLDRKERLVCQSSSRKLSSEINSNSIIYCCNKTQCDCI